MEQETMALGDVTDRDLIARLRRLVRADRTLSAHARASRGDGCTRFTYRTDIAHHLQDVYDAAGNHVAAMDYDASGRLTKTCDAEGACGRSSYDLTQRSVVQTDATSRLVKYSYDLCGNVTSQTDGLNHTTSFAYDAFDNLVRAEGPDGSVATYTYDGR